MPEYGEVLRRIFFSDAAFIFSKRNIQDPVQAIFDTPMASHSMCEAFGIIIETTNVVRCFNADVVADMAFALNHADGFEVFPSLFTLQPINA